MSSGCRLRLDKTMGLCKVNFRDPEQFYMTCLRSHAKSAFMLEGHHVLPTLKTTTTRDLIVAALILDIMLSLRL